MFGNQNLDRVYELFADQFEQEGDGFVYRKSLKGAAKRISTAERDDFILSFRRSYRRMFWAWMAAIFCGIFAYIGWTVYDDREMSELALYLGIAAFFAMFLFSHYYVWGAPARALERRAAIGRERTRQEVRRLMLEKMTWGQLGVAAGLTSILMLKVSAKGNLTVGWNRLWLVFAGLMVVMIGIQAFRKWRFDKDKV
jgi:hypothetical protein